MRFYMLTSNVYLYRDKKVAQIAATHHPTKLKNKHADSTEHNNKFAYQEHKTQTSTGKYRQNNTRHKL